MAAGLVAAIQEPSYALIFDNARNAIIEDMTASGFDNPEVIGLIFGLVEMLLLVIPAATGLAAVAQMNRGQEAWMPWAMTMGGSLVLLAFVAGISKTIYG